jgi:hypothetical protein
MEREEIIKQLRPDIDSKKGGEQSDYEVFQNEVLRPILKFQNDVLKLLFQNQLIKFKANWETMDPKEKRSFFDKQFNGDAIYKNFYIGMIIGFFTKEEFEFYSNHQKEVHKRIMSMLRKRLEE